MKVTKDGFKDRQLHIEDYLQMVSAEQKEYAEVSAHQRIAENNDIITDIFKRKMCIRDRWKMHRNPSQMVQQNRQESFRN